MNGPFGHHWSGWPGAYCLKCHSEDPHEIALADGDMYFDEVPGDHPEDEPTMDLRYKSAEVQERLSLLNRCPVYGVLDWNSLTGTFDLLQEERDTMTDAPRHQIQQYMDLMGRKVRDRVNGFEGVVTAVTFDLYGCVQCIVNPPSAKADGGFKIGELQWFDHKRLDVLENTPVMALPWFAAPEDASTKAAAAPAKVGDENGPEIKPSPHSA